MSEVRSNLHTHTFRCGHATGEVIDYARAAVDAGLECLGISDHTPLPDGRWNNIRMNLEELPGYLAAIDEAVQALPQLRLLQGMECEYTPGYHTFYADVLLGEYGLDYLVGAVHLIPMDGEWVYVFGGTRSRDALRVYAAEVIRAMESGLFTFMAHPDLFANAYLAWDDYAQGCARDILAAAESLAMPLEINGYGFLKPRVSTPDGERHMYPIRRFWELAAGYNIRFLTNSDAHAPENIVAGTAQARAMGTECGLTLVDPQSLV